MYCYCCAGISGRPKTKAFAIWIYERNGFQEGLCKSCLDSWLDNADDDDELEPANVIFL